MQPYPVIPRPLMPCPFIPCPMPLPPCVGQFHPPCAAALATGQYHPPCAAWVIRGQYHPPVCVPCVVCSSAWTVGVLRTNVSINTAPTKIVLFMIVLPIYQTINGWICFSIQGNRYDFRPPCLPVRFRGPSQPPVPPMLSPAAGPMCHHPASLFTS
jgi:hypothetical protein